MQTQRTLMWTASVACLLLSMTAQAQHGGGHHRTYFGHPGVGPYGPVFNEKNQTPYTASIFGYRFCRTPYDEYYSVLRRQAILSAKYHHDLQKLTQCAAKIDFSHKGGGGGCNCNPWGYNGMTGCCPGPGARLGGWLGAGYSDCMGGGCGLGHGGCGDGCGHAGCGKKLFGKHKGDCGIEGDCGMAECGGKKLFGKHKGDCGIEGNCGVADCGTGHKWFGGKVGCGRCGKHGCKGCDGHCGDAYRPSLLRGFNHIFCKNKGKGFGDGGFYGDMGAGGYGNGGMWPNMNREDALRYLEGFQYYPPHHLLRSPRDFFMFDVKYGM